MAPVVLPLTRLRALSAGTPIKAVKPGWRKAEDFSGCEELGLDDWRTRLGNDYGFADKIEGHFGKEFGRGGG